ncbi:alpha/beta fold hydrolase [Actinoallomurus rhizosphaericola]|uniref:alpha/beta fold hydrolase n=1 Tax=Actinoallomurus rhizosphaericola TaxID=2952536 RepID=UPI002092E370|nr:alpha/beta hydrolase [Actinoallomurus rhizosphaericola]MCO6000257.1 alpha/beta hydrolase [Actinoallomurus rhizosphaericola]
MEQLTVNIAGQQIAYLESPGGRGSQDDRAVIFVHGNSSSARTWLPVLTGNFGRQFRCLALDLPGHGQSEPARDQSDYSLPGYAAVLADFARTLGAADAVVVGWSMGGQIVLEAAPTLQDAAGFVIFGAPPVASAAQFTEAFLPNPVMNAIGSASLSESEARSFAESFTAPGSALATSEFVSDILATDGAARAGLGSSVGEGRFADEVAIVAELRRPLAILHGAGEQLVNLDYLRKLTIPALWRGQVQLIPHAGHAPHQETPQQFAALLTDFIGDLGG